MSAEGGKRKLRRARLLLSFLPHRGDFSRIEERRNSGNELHVGKRLLDDDAVRHAFCSPVSRAVAGHIHYGDIPIDGASVARKLPSARSSSKPDICYDAGNGRSSV